MDLSQLGKSFLDCNLSEDNILDFMAKEQNDIEKYVLKLYLLSVLEDHHHIDILRKDIFFDQKFEDTPQNEIINKKVHKEFWEKVVELKNENQSKVIRFLSIVYNSSLLGKFGYFICSIEEDENKLNELNAKLNNEENLLEKIKLRKQIIALIKERKKCKKSIIRSLHTTEEEFDHFAEMSLKYYKTFDWEKIASEDGVRPTSRKINEYYFNFELRSFLKSFKELNNIIVSLESDLFSAYKMICACFDNDILKEENFLNIISKIRICMSKKYAASPSMINNNLLDEYRLSNLSKHEFANVGGSKLIKSSGFWDKTAHYKEITKLMEKLNERYEKIKLIENTNEYIYACYELTQDFLQIHPYMDGNGRTSKFLFYVLLLKRNVLPFTITDSRDLPKCFERHGRTKSYVDTRQKIMNDRIDNQELMTDNSESIKNKK